MQDIRGQEVPQDVWHHFECENPKCVSNRESGCLAEIRIPLSLSKESGLDTIACPMCQHSMRKTNPPDDYLD